MKPHSIFLFGEPANVSPRTLGSVKIGPGAYARWLAIYLIAAILIVGCERKPVARVTTVAPVASAGSGEDLTAAMDMIAKWEQIDDFHSAPDVLYHLNRWAESQEFDKDWKPDPLLERLPKNLRQIFDFKVLSKDSYETSDLLYLREAYWMREISRWVSRQPVSANFNAWMEKINPPLEPEVATQLAIADRLFDWTVRNVQLDPLLPVVQEKTLGPTSPAVPGKMTNDTPPLPPAARGEPGPGYRHELWHLLFFGHGDAWERARVFMALARQQDLETVMLGIEDPQSIRPARPWLPAVLLNGKLYLFDSALGMPLPANALDSILTLDQLQAKPELLETLSVDDKHPYPVTKADLENVVALVDASPESLSWRMKKLEPNLVGNNRLSLATSLTEIAEKLRKLPEIKKIVPWGVPWETALYWNTITSPQYRPAKPPVELSEMQIFTAKNPLARALTRGRNRHLRGEFDKPEGERGAKTYYLEARLPDTFIKTVQGDLQQKYCFQAKARASYWLGLIQYETGEYVVSEDWLKGRMLDAKETDFNNGARYNLGRSYEQLGQLENARETYLADTTSPQKEGNALRAKLLLEK